MFRWLLAIFIIVPVIEISLFIWIGHYIGFGAAIAFILLTSILGAWLAKREGLETLNQVRLQMSRGQLPGQSLLDGACIIAGGALLLTPGFFTDFIGFVFLFPPLRKWAKRFLLKLMKRAIDKRQFSFYWKR